LGTQQRLAYEEASEACDVIIVILSPSPSPIMSEPHTAESGKTFWRVMRCCINTVGIETVMAWDNKTADGIERI
jgi:hypothetical protein